MLRLILGAAGSGKTRRVCEEIRDGMRGRDGLVLLTPEQQSHRAERRLAAVCGPALSLHGEVLSFTRMYNRAALEIGGLADPLPDKGGRLLMMALALEEAGPKLTCFRERGKRTDFLRRLMTTAEELRGSMTTAAEL
ncbi:MAG: ATP-dependent nuclease subunit B, partial [Oscillospiraceae bacterium]|nr:ATP-dependent nuclease subunit B [Oscillospiraceae bacterium]